MKRICNDSGLKFVILIVFLYLGLFCFFTDKASANARNLINDFDYSNLSTQEIQQETKLLYKYGKKSYATNDLELAKLLFYQILELDPDHRGANKYIDYYIPKKLRMAEYKRRKQQKVVLETKEKELLEENKEQPKEVEKVIELTEKEKKTKEKYFKEELKRIAREEKIKQKQELKKKKQEEVERKRQEAISKKERARLERENKLAEKRKVEESKGEQIEENKAYQNDLKRLVKEEKERRRNELKEKKRQEAISKKERVRLEKEKRIAEERKEKEAEKLEIKQANKTKKEKEEEAVQRYEHSTEVSIQKENWNQIKDLYKEGMLGYRSGKYGPAQAVFSKILNME